MNVGSYWKVLQSAQFYVYVQNWTYPDLERSMCCDMICTNAYRLEYQSVILYKQKHFMSATHNYDSIIINLYSHFSKQKKFLLQQYYIVYGVIWGEVFPTFYFRRNYKKVAIVRVKFGNKNLMRQGLTKLTFTAIFFLIVILETDYLIYVDTGSVNTMSVGTTFRMCCIQVFRFSTYMHLVLTAREFYDP